MDQVSALQYLKKGLPREEIRTRLSLGEEGDPLIESLGNGLLMFRDQTVQEMSHKDALITLNLIAGRRQVDIARSLKLSQSRISDVSRKKGAAILIQHLKMLEEATKNLKNLQRRTNEAKE